MAKTRRSKKTRSRRKSRKTLRGGTVDHVASYLKKDSDFYNSVEADAKELINDELALKKWMDNRKLNGDTRRPIIYEIDKSGTWKNVNFKNAVFDTDLDEEMMIRFGLIKDLIGSKPGVTDDFIVDYLRRRFIRPKEELLILTTYDNYEIIKKKYDKWHDDMRVANDQEQHNEDDIQDVS